MSREKTVAAEVAAAAERPAGRANLLMYVGPSLTSPVPLVHRSVFKGGRPAFLGRLAPETREALTPCFLPLAEAGRALRELEGAREAGEITAHYKKTERLLRRK